MIQLGFLDPYRLIVWSFRERGSLKPTEDAGVSHIVILDEKWRHPNLDKWGTVKAAIARARKLAERGEMRLVKVALEAMEPGAVLPWERGTTSEMVVDLALLSSPGAMLYEGTASVSPVPGCAWGRGAVALWRSAANHGEHQRLSLVLTLRAQDGEDQL